MHRLFLHIPGSPQATPVVETPAHYAPTLFLELALRCPRWWLGM